VTHLETAGEIPGPREREKRKETVNESNSRWNDRVTEIRESGKVQQWQEKISQAGVREAEKRESSERS